MLHIAVIIDAWTTTSDTPYKMKLTDAFGNIHVQDADCCVDKHNQARQFELAFENK